MQKPLHTAFAQEKQRKVGGMCEKVVKYLANTYLCRTFATDKNEDCAGIIAARNTKALTAAHGHTLPCIHTAAATQTKTLG